MTIVRETLLRGPLFPDPETDQGGHTFTTVLAPGAGIPATIALGYSLNFPLRTVTGAHDVEPLVRVTGDGVVVDTVKCSDDGGGDVIVRLYEAFGRQSTADIEALFPYESVAVTDLREQVKHVPNAVDDPTKLRLRPFEVVTLRFRRTGA